MNDDSRAQSSADTFSVAQFVEWAKTDGWEGELRRLRKRVKAIPASRRRSRNRALEDASKRAEAFASNALALLPELNPQGKLRAEFVAQTARVLAGLVRSMKVSGKK